MVSLSVVSRLWTDKDDPSSVCLVTGEGVVAGICRFTIGDEIIRAGEEDRLKRRCCVVSSLGFRTLPVAFSPKGRVGELRRSLPSL